jgi:hypothetical protein
MSDSSDDDLDDVVGPTVEEIQRAAGLGSLGAEEDTDEADQIWGTIERMQREIDALQKFRGLAIWLFWIAIVLAWCAGIWIAGR